MACALDDTALYAAMEWDWLKFYLFLHSGFYTFEYVEMGVLYQDFAEKNKDFTEEIVNCIEDELEKDSRCELER